MIDKGIYPERDPERSMVRLRRRLSRNGPETSLAPARLSSGEIVFCESGSRRTWQRWIESAIFAIGAVVVLLFLPAVGGRAFWVFIGLLIATAAGLAIAAIVSGLSQKLLIVDTGLNQVKVVDDHRIRRQERSLRLDDLWLMTHEVTLYGTRARDPIWRGYSLVAHTPFGVWCALVTKSDEWQINEYRRKLPVELGPLYRGPGPSLSASY